MDFDIWNKLRKLWTWREQVETTGSTTDAAQNLLIAGKMDKTPGAHGTILDTDAQGNARRSGLSTIAVATALYETIPAKMGLAPPISSHGKALHVDDGAGQAGVSALGLLFDPGPKLFSISPTPNSIFDLEWPSNTSSFNIGTNYAPHGVAQFTVGLDNQKVVAAHNVVIAGVANITTTDRIVAVGTSLAPVLPGVALGTEQSPAKVVTQESNGVAAAKLPFCLVGTHECGTSPVETTAFDEITNGYYSVRYIEGGSPAVPTALCFVASTEEGGIKYATLPFRPNADTTFWDDEKIDILRVKTKGSNITVNEAESAVSFAAGLNAANDYVYANVQFSHKRKLHTKVYPHVHWWQAGTGKPAFIVFYRWQANNGGKATEWIPLPLYTPAFAYSVGTINQISTNTTGIPAPASDGTSDILQLRLTRADGLGITDNYSGAALVTSIDVHIQCDQSGTWYEYQNTPPVS